jgi:hypothetical protein
MVASLWRNDYLARMHMCFQHYVTVLYAILCLVLKFTWGGLPCQKIISELILYQFYICTWCPYLCLSMTSRVFFILLTCRLCFITTMFMSEEDQVKPRSSVQFLDIRSSLVIFALFYFQFLKPKNHQKILLLTLLTLVCKLASCCCLTTTTLGMLSCLFTVASCLKCEEKELTSDFPESLILPWVTLMGKTSFATSLCESEERGKGTNLKFKVFQISIF